MKTISPSIALDSLTISSPSGIPTEIELLFCCARTQIEPEIAHRIQGLLQADIDWSYVLKLAIGHRVLPLVYKSLCTIQSDAIPAVFFAELHEFFQDNLLRNLSLTREAVRLIDLLQQQGINAIAFKGVALTLSVYGDIALRQFDDLDILVSKQDFLKARDVLIASGDYQQPNPSHFLTVEEEATYLQAHCECSLIHQNEQFSIDLHQELTGGVFLSYPFNFETLYQRLVPVSSRNQLLSLCPEDLLLYLCVHGAKSLWERLAWICDIAELIRTHPEIDWEMLLQTARQVGLERILLLGLCLARNILGVSLTANILTRIKADREVQALAQHVFRRLCSGNYALTKTLTFEKFCFQYRSIETLDEQIQYCLRCFLFHGLTPLRRLLKPTSKDKAFLLLPRSLYFLYYLLRPVRLLGSLKASLCEWWLNKQKSIPPTV